MTLPTTLPTLPTPLTAKDIGMMHQIIHEYEIRENWRIIHAWVEQCYAPGTVASFEVSTHGEYDKYNGPRTRISAAVAYNTEGDVVPYDLARPFFQVPKLSARVQAYLSLLREGERPDPSELWDILRYSSSCYGVDWVCPSCTLPREDTTYDLLNGEPPLNWEVSLRRLVTTSTLSLECP